VSRKRIRNILLKEWRVLFTDVGNTLIVTVLPFFIVGQLLLYVWLAVNFGGEKALGADVFQNAIARLTQAQPAVATLSSVEQFQALLLNQFAFFMLLIPVMISINTVTFSIVEEKLSGSLEALLATPVRTWELLMGKALAGAIPALLVTWLCAGAFLLAVVALGWGHLVRLVANPVWFISLLVLNPAVTVLSFLLGVIGSARARDAKNAQNLVVAIILPLLGVVAIQVTGVVWFTPLTMLALAAGLVVVDYLALKVAVRLFQRESIVVNWR